MDADQDRLANPLGHDPDCRNCPELCAVRDRIVHGYGDVGADFLFIGETPTAAAEANGVPFTGDAAGRRLQSILGALELSQSPPRAADPTIENAYLAYLARCRHPERAPTDDEITTCSAYRTAEVRMINPEVIVPIGERTLRTLATEYTTRDPETLSMPEAHATEIRGRGFELFPLVELDSLTESTMTTFVKRFGELMDRDYRKPKGPHADREE
ncbi:MAG: uracil-DNA glycosylase family protein [Halobacteriales archaeon]